MLKKYLESLNKAPFMFHSINKSGIIEYASDGWLETLGYDRKEVIGKPFINFLTSSSKVYAETVILPSFWKTGVCKNIHYKMIKKNNNIIDILYHSIAEEDNDGTYECCLAFSNDITDRILVENELRQYRDDLELLVLERTEELEETKEMYKILSKASPVGIFRSDRNGKCTYVNEQWRQFTGMSKKDSLGDGWINAIYHEDKDRVSKEWKVACNNNVEFYSEYRFINSEGKIIWVLGQANPVYGGLAGGHVGTVTNITKKKEVLPKLIELKNLKKCRGIL